MPYRRSYSKYRARPRTGLRRRTGLRKITQNGAERWERAEIGFQAGLSVTDDVEHDSLSISIAQVTGHLLSRADAVATQQAVSLENFARRMEIGGISMDLTVRVPAHTPLGQAGTENDEVFTQLGLVLAVDRLDNAGVPNALAPRWGRAGTPMVDPGSISTQDEDNDFPQRILWRRATCIDWNVEANTNSEYQFQSRQHPSAFHVNRRLRLQLQEDQGLFLYIWTRRAFNWPTETVKEYNILMSGSLYYRVRF